jgi:hypothetical protein
MSVSKACDEYFAARHAYDEAKKIVAARAHTMNVKMNALIDAMNNEKMKAYPRTDGRLVSLKKSFKFSCTKDNLDETREWLVEAIGDDSDYVKEVVNKKALKELLTNLDKEGQHIPEFLHVSTRPSVSVRGWKDEEDEEEET